MSVFAFKAFTVQQSNSALKVSTDAILLGASIEAHLPNAKVLDVGTGTGVIALLLAHRYASLTIDALDSDPLALKDAQHNFAHAPYGQRLKLFHTDLAAHPHDHYDLIVSNPPYFLESLTPEESAKQQAKHLTKKAFHDLLLQMKLRLQPKGQLWLILPPQSANEAIAYFETIGLYLRLKLRFHANPSKPDKRWVVCFSFESGRIEQRELMIRELDGSFHQDYKLLAGHYHDRPL